METKFILYRIWYGTMLVYVGQTIQKLEQRMRQHFLYDNDLDINATTLIEFAYLNSQADLNVYELYFINKYRAFENRLGLTNDKLTITLPELNWQNFDEKHWKKIKGKGNSVGVRSLPKNYHIDERLL